MNWTTQKYNRYYADKELRIKQAMDTLSIDMDERGTFAIVPSTSSTGTYRVDIDEESQRIPQAIACECKGNSEFGHVCVHMQATQRMFDRVCARPVATPDQFVKGFSPESDLVTACSVSEAVADADTQVRINEKNELVANDKTYAEMVGYAGDPRIEVVSVSDEWQAYRYYEMSIGAL